MTTLNIEGRRVKVSDDFKNLSPEEQERTVEEIAEQLRIQPQAREPALSQLNLGIADAVGGLVDAINPFDTPAVSQALGMGDTLTTGSAREPIMRGMEAINAVGEDREPETNVEALMRGGGKAAGAAIPVTKAAQFAGRAPGMVGAVADDVYSGLNSLRAFAAEILAGGTSETAEKAARDAGLPEWAQTTAALVAPMGIPAAAAAANQGLKVAGKAPLASLAAQGARRVAAEAAPYTKSGARAVARDRLQGLAGGRERADELAGRIRENDNPINLTPAQQTDDPNMIAVEQLAAAQDPNLRARLEERATASRATAEGQLTAQGDIADTRNFFETRRRAYTDDLTARAQDAIDRTQRGVDGIAPVRSEGENSLQVSNRINEALAEATQQEAALWNAVPRGVQVPTANARSTAANLIESTPRAQQKDIPAVARELLGGEGGFGEMETVSEMHGLYSELRRVARSAMAGNDQNKNMARVANEIADAILVDLGTVDPNNDIGRAINDARAFSSALHETFDRGAVGRLLKRTLDGDTAVDPELALKRTVGRGGVEAAVGARQIKTAAPGSEPFVADYIKQRFQDTTMTPTGEFNNAAARKFMRDNRDLLKRYPELRADIDDAVTQRDNADAFAARIEQRIKRLNDARISAGARLLNGSPESAIKAFTEARNPVRAARSLVNEAAKDETGQALSGLKNLLSSHLIRKSGVTGDGIENVLSDPKLKAAFRQVFSSAEMSRMNRLARELGKLDEAQRAAPSIGNSLSGATPNKVIEYLARMVAARQGAEMGGGGGGSLQTAQMASSRIKEILGRITSDRASALLADAIEDPDLFRALLTDLGDPQIEQKAINRMVPYLVGGTVGAITE